MKESMLRVRMSESDFAELQSRAELLGMTASALVRMLIRNHAEELNAGKVSRFSRSKGAALPGKVNTHVARSGKLRSRRS
jgi:hypothetical protein